MAGSKSGIPIYADTAALSRLSRGLRQASPMAWAAYKVAVKAAAEVVEAEMASRAPGSRIKDSGEVVPTPGGNVKIVFTAPDAAPIENKGKGFVRHPTFGPRGTRMTSKNSHPAFAAPALAARQEQMLGAIEDALVKAIDRALGGL